MQRLNQALQLKCSRARSRFCRLPAKPLVLWWGDAHIRREMITAEDDFVAPFQIETGAVRGRIARLGPAIDDILTRHAYPGAVAALLGQACALAALVGASLKFDGRLIVQAQGDGPVAYVVADYDTGGALRGYCRFAPERVTAGGPLLG